MEKHTMFVDWKNQYCQNGYTILIILWNSALKWVCLFILCFLFLFFSQLFVRPPQTAILLYCIIFLEDGPDSCLQYNAPNLPPQLIRHSLYQMQSLKSISHFHCIVIRDLIQVIPEWSSGFLHFLQFKSEFGNKEFMICPANKFISAIFLDSLHVWQYVIFIFLFLTSLYNRLYIHPPHQN